MSSTTSNDDHPKTRTMTRLRPEGAEQDALDKEALKKTASNLSVNDQSGCLPALFCGNFSLDVRRKPISVIAAKSFWTGVSDIKDVLTPANPLLENSSTFYIQDSRRSTLDSRTSSAPDDHFFEDINTLYKRQTALFQRSCEQLKDLYNITDDPEEPDHQADANVSEFVLLENVVKEDQQSETTSENTTLDGTLGSTGIITDEHKIFQNSIRKSKIAFKSRLDILKAVTGKMIQNNYTNNAFGATDMVDVEDLYAEVIFCILHMIGNDAPNDENVRFHLIEHLRKAFRVEPKVHLRLYEKASLRPRPQLKLNLCVLEAKDLACKDNLSSNENVSRGDPFCTVHLKSSPFDMKNTTCKSRTVNPVWNESFILDLDYDKPEDTEILHVDVWNFMPDENLREKLRKINEVRDSKGLRQFIMDTVSGKSNQNTNKLIGSVEINLCDIPASGLNQWWNLEKNGKHKGLVHLLLHLSTNSQKRATMAAQHRRLLRILLAHELLRKECKPFEWRDEFAVEALNILAQHAVQVNI